MDINLKALIGRFTPEGTAILQATAGYCVTRSHNEVTVEHFLLQALDAGNSDIPCILKGFELSRDSLRVALQKAIEPLHRDSTSRPAFSSQLVELLQQAWLLGSIEYGSSRLRTGYMLLALIARPFVFGHGSWTDVLRPLRRDILFDQFREITAGSSEREQSESVSSQGESPAVTADGGEGEGFIAQFCVDFMEKARQGKIDPVFGRDKEIRQIVDILARRRKNNPILVADPGVGKTAVVEGLALRVADGDVPDSLKKVRLLALDMGALEAGAGVKGEFERRLRGVIKGVQNSPEPVILFIDEAHTLVGAGGSAGSSDAANLLKPILSRGELKTIAATTWSEYKRYFEKDAALARRFQLVKLEEPDENTTLQILRGLRESYEDSHGVIVRDEALRAAAAFAVRYNITGRFLPDKAIDLLDTSCARVKVNLAAKPGALEDAERELQHLEREQGVLDRDKAHGCPVDEEAYADLTEGISRQREVVADLLGRWQKEKEQVERVLELRASMGTGKRVADFESSGRLKDPEEQQAERSLEGIHPAEESLDKESGTEASLLSSEKGDSSDIASGDNPMQCDEENSALSLEEAAAAYEAALADLRNVQGDAPMIYIEVTPELVAQVLSDWTGIPAGKICRDETQILLHLESRLKESIKGQDAALEEIAQVLRASLAGIRSPEQPLGVFMLAGPSGVGKTETGRVLAELLFGGERNLVVINLSEFQEKHTVSRLIGSPPGYVGYGEGGMLTEAVRRSPYSVVLLDEMEKAHPEVLNLFYQVFDKGMLTDGEGKEISFRNTLILLTSNAGSEVMERFAEMNTKPPAEELKDVLHEVLLKQFKAALLGRMRVIPYHLLSEDALGEVVRLKLAKIQERLWSNNRIEFSWEESVEQAVASACRSAVTGARNIDAILNGTVVPDMARTLLEAMSEGEMPGKAMLRVTEEGKYVADFYGG